MLAVVNIPWLHKETASTSHEGALYATLACIGQGNPSLAQAIHDDKSPPPFSAHLESGLLRVGCLTADVFMAIADSKLAYKAIRVKEDNFDTILERSEGKSTLKLSFITPTSIGHRSRGRGYLLPEPGRVFGSLIRRWKDAGGPEIPQLTEDMVGVLSVRISTERRVLSRYTQYGFVGYALYELPKEVACWYHALAMFAEYSGVGQRTSQGFGQVRYETTNGLNEG